MSSFQSSEEERHDQETDPKRVFGPTVERLPLMLVGFGIAVIVGTALTFGSAVGVVASLLIEVLFLLVTVPLTLLLVLGIARMTDLYFGTLGQAIVRLTSFFVASEGAADPGRFGRRTLRRFFRGDRGAAGLPEHLVLVVRGPF